IFTGVSPRNIPESRSMVTTRRCSVISRTVRVLGTATSMPDCSTGAVIIKITRRTSTTSTSGVMLMSASDVWVRPLLLVKATFYLVWQISPRQITALEFAGGHLAALGRSSLSRRWRGGRRAGLNLFERIQQLPAEIVDGRCEDFDARRELVISRHGGHGDEQAGGSGD